MKTKTKTKMKQLPILYSLRNCPYAMRARIAIFKSQQKIELRDVVLNNKPEEMLDASPKGTVPVLVYKQQNEQLSVIDESLDIMLWALKNSDPYNLLQRDAHQANPLENGIKNNPILSEMLKLIYIFDNEFKSTLEAYKCAKRYHETNLEECRKACETYLKPIEECLNKHLYIMSNNESLVDIALLPFIRQFARVERQWYLQSPYPKLRQWLNNYLQSPMFTKVMAKYPLWQKNNKLTVFG